MEGQSLADFVQWEDLQDFNDMWPSRNREGKTLPGAKSQHRLYTDSPETRKIRFMNFVVPYASGAPSTQPRTSSGLSLDLDGHGRSYGVVREVSGIVDTRDDDDTPARLPSGDELGCSAYDFDPLFFEETAHSNTLEDLRCQFLEADVHVLDLSSSGSLSMSTSDRALVCMCLR